MSTRPKLRFDTRGWWAVFPHPGPHLSEVLVGPFEGFEEAALHALRSRWRWSGVK